MPYTEDLIYDAAVMARKASDEDLIEMLAEVSDEDLEVLAAYCSKQLADLSLAPTSDAVMWAELEASDILSEVWRECEYRHNTGTGSPEPFPVALGILSDGTHVPIPLY